MIQPHSFTGRSAGTVRRVLVSLALFLSAALVVSGCMSRVDSSGGDGDTVVRFGTMDVSKTYWPIFKQKAADEGITIEETNFTEYSPVNTALADGQLDVNLFQHMQYLAEFNRDNGTDLVPVGPTEIVPLGLYAKDAKKPEDLKQGTEIAIPNDGSNQGRAINVLVQAGLVTLKEKGTFSPSPADIDQGASKVKVKPVDAAQTVLAYNDGTPAVINNTFLADAGLDPDTAVFKDDPNNELAAPYINIFATTPDKQDDETLNKLVEIWHSPEVVEAVREDSKNSSVEVKKSNDEVKDLFKDIEERVGE